MKKFNQESYDKMKNLGKEVMNSNSKRKLNEKDIFVLEHTNIIERDNKRLFTYLEIENVEEKKWSMLIGELI